MLPVWCSTICFTMNEFTANIKVHSHGPLLSPWCELHCKIPDQTVELGVNTADMYEIHEMQDKHQEFGFKIKDMQHWQVRRSSISVVESRKLLLQYVACMAVFSLIKYIYTIRLCFCENVLSFPNSDRVMSPTYRSQRSQIQSPQILIEQIPKK